MFDKGYSVQYRCNIIQYKIIQYNTAVSCNTAHTHIRLQQFTTPDAIFMSKNFTAPANSYTINTKRTVAYRTAHCSTAVACYIEQ